MPHVSVADVQDLRGAPGAPARRVISDNHPEVGSGPVPEFVRRAVAEGYSQSAALALYRQIAKTRADVRARRITPAGGIRRVERLALAVGVAAAVLK